MAKKTLNRMMTLEDKQRALAEDRSKLIPVTSPGNSYQFSFCQSGSAWGSPRTRKESELKPIVPLEETGEAESISERGQQNNLSMVSSEEKVAENGKKLSIIIPSTEFEVDLVDSPDKYNTSLTGICEARETEEDLMTPRAVE